MRVDRDAWLSAIMERGVYRVSLAPGDVPEAGTVGALAPRDGETAAMFFARVPASDVAPLAALTRGGFEVIDAALTFEADRAAPAPPSPAGIEVGPADPRRHDQILEIAATAFRYSRFHLDPRVPPALAHRVKREWIASYVAGRRGAVLLEAVIGGQAAGFLAVIDGDSGGRRARIIDLVGVSPAFQGRGVGTALVAYFLRAYRDAFDVLQVGTQAANAPSIRMYEKCGFRFAAAAYVAHLHVPRA